MSNFFKWLGQPPDSRPDPGNAQEAKTFREMETIWKAAAVDAPPEPDTAAAWRETRRRMAEEPEPQGGWPFGSWFRPALALAALALVAAILTFVWQGPDANAEIVAQRGERRTATLPDGSTVKLNADSRLTYTDGFGAEHRETRIEGEAFFDVVAGETPFLVRTEAATVEVKGTRFNVFARQGRTEVTVAEGVVAVAAARAGDGVTLRAGQYTVCLAGGDPSAPAASSYGGKPDWLANRIHPNGAPLTRVLAEIERRFDIRIRLDRDALGETPIDGMLTGDKPEDMLRSVCSLIESDYRQSEGVYIIE